jgi:2-octaprenyl-6-methoxyphenol hydroxylase
MTIKSDIIIAGAALNGLAAAVALGGAQLRRPLKVTIIDAKEPREFSSKAFDGRASAITASAQRMFEVLGVWSEIAPQAQAMQEIVVTDARPGAEARPILLHFGEADMRGAPSAHMVENRHLYGALLSAATASPHISFVTGHAAKEFRFGPGLAEVTLDNGAGLKASLIVAADGRNSAARAAAHIDLVGWSYDQVGIVATVEHDLPHGGRAEEHFTPSGPFAILPLPGSRSSLVWTETKADAERILGLNEAEFLAELRRRFGDRLGDVRLAGGRHSYPLAMFIAREFTGPRLALIGDAAHVVHPIAGLGFNLGLRDVAALAESVHDAFALGLDPSGDAVLERYRMWRRFDTVMTALTMDGLNRLFANDNAVLRLLRDAGLIAAGSSSVLKSLFIKEAEGQTGSLPKWLRGEAF